MTVALPGGPGRRLAVAALVALVALAPRAAAAEEPVVPPGPFAPASQPLVGTGIVPGKTLQPGEPGYKSPSVAAGWSFGSTLLPIIVGGFMVRSQTEATRWIGFGLIVTGQSVGPSAGFWYAGERARFTWQRLGLSLVAMGAAAYPLYAYTGTIENKYPTLTMGLTIVAVVAEAFALSLAAWDMTLLGETVEQHNFKPNPPQSRPKVAFTLLPFAGPNVGGLTLGGQF